MTYQLPPLNALRAFEAAARHLSFKAAAGELRVTPGAVSQQVRSLEGILGVALFERVHQGLMLTEAGQRYLTPLRHAFDVISIATQSVAPRKSGTELVLAAPPDFAVHWLLPALDGFQASNPALNLKIAEATGPDAVLQGRAAIAVLPGLSSHPELTATHLVDDLRFPAGAPLPVEAVERPLADRLNEETLLVADDERLWRQALGGGDAPSFDTLARLAFARRDLAVRAAELGRGIVLASSVEDTSPLAAGRLVAVAGGPSVLAARWYALCPPGRLDCPEEHALLDWLVRAGVAAPGVASPRTRRSSSAA